MRHSPLALLMLAAMGLAGCVQTAAPPVAPRPVAAPVTPARVTTADPYAVLTQTAPAPVPVVAPMTPAPVPAAPSGPRDARTGLHQRAVVAVTGDGARGFTVMFRAEATDAAAIAAAPATLCRSAGGSVADSRTRAPKPGSAMPGVSIMVVKCAGGLAGA